MTLIWIITNLFISFFYAREINFNFWQVFTKKLTNEKKLWKVECLKSRFFLQFFNHQLVQNPGISFWLCHKGWSWQQSSHGDSSIEFFYFFWLSSPIGNAQFGHQDRWTCRYLLHHNYIHQNCKQCLWQVKPPLCFHWYMDDQPLEWKRKILLILNLKKI